MDATPKHIDKYEVLGLLGRGATSTVYRAVDPFAEREVAIKLFNSSVLSDPAQGKFFRKLIKTEAALVGRLNHPHIVAIHDAVLSDAVSYIVMEYVDGGSLEARCALDTLLEPRAVLEAIFKCAQALSYASRNGVIHRDIKPANIMLTRTGEVKIADFGAAEICKSEQTQVVGIGSPAYMSPEQIRQDPLTHQSDVYSLGVVMYRLLTGELPFKAENTAALTHEILTLEPPPVSALRPGLSTRLDAIVARAMRKDCAERYPDWAAFSNDLSAVAAIDLPQDVISDLEKFNAVKSLPFFRGFGDIELWEVLRISAWRRVAAGGRIVAEGEPGSDFFIVSEGKVRIEKGGVLLGEQNAGACFGEMSYIRRGALPRTATVSAATPVTLLEISGDALHNASEACQLRFNQAFLDILVDRLAQTSSELVGR